MVGFMASSMLHTMHRPSVCYACRASQLHEARPVHQRAACCSCVILLCTGYNRVSTLIAVYSDHAMEAFARKQVCLWSALRRVTKTTWRELAAMNDTLTSSTSCQIGMQQLEHADTLQPTRLSGKDVHGSCPSSHSLPPMHNWIRCCCRPNLAWTWGLRLDAPTRLPFTPCKVLHMHALSWMCFFCIVQHTRCFSSLCSQRGCTGVVAG